MPPSAAWTATGCDGCRWPTWPPRPACPAARSTGTSPIATPWWRRARAHRRSLRRRLRGGPRPGARRWPARWPRPCLHPPHRRRRGAPPARRPDSLFATLLTPTSSHLAAAGSPSGCPAWPPPSAARAAPGPRPSQTGGLIVRLMLSFAVMPAVCSTRSRSPARGARQRAPRLPEHARAGGRRRAPGVGRVLDRRAPLPRGVLALLEPRGALRRHRRATERMRLGYGVRLMPKPYNHPVRTAESVAVLDLISDGRVDFGTGRSATRAELEGFGIDPHQTRGCGRRPSSTSSAAGPTTSTSSTASTGRCRAGCCPSRSRSRTRRSGAPPRATTATAQVGELGLGLCSFAVGVPPEEVKKKIDIYREAVAGAREPIGEFVNDQAATFTMALCADRPTRRRRPPASRSSGTPRPAPGRSRRSPSGWPSAAGPRQLRLRRRPAKIDDEGSLDLLSLEYLVDSGACVLGTRTSASRRASATRRGRRHAALPRQPVQDPARRGRRLGPGGLGRGDHRPFHMTAARAFGATGNTDRARGVVRVPVWGVPTSVEPWTPEPVALADALSSGFEAAIVLIALGILIKPGVSPAAWLRPTLGLPGGVGASAVAIGVLSTMALSPSFASGHSTAPRRPAPTGPRPRPPTATPTPATPGSPASRGRRARRGPHQRGHRRRTAARPASRPASPTRATAATATAARALRGADLRRAPSSWTKSRRPTPVVATYPTPVAEPRPPAGGASPRTCPASPPTT